MADLTINLNFIPVNLDGNNILNITLAKEVGRALCESIGTSMSYEKYKVGKSLYTTGSYTFTDIESQETINIITYFKKLCENYGGWSNEVKGQILEKFNQ